MKPTRTVACILLKLAWQAVLVCSALTTLLLTPLAAFCAEAGPETIRCELAVIGGGSGGFGAALAAARLGVDVVLVERSDRLGGNSVRGGVNIWEPGLGGTGFPFEIYRRLKREPKAVGIYSMGRHMGTFDPAREAYPFPGGETVIDPALGYLDSLQRLQALDIERIFPAHGPVIEEPHDKIGQYLAHRALRDEQILAGLGAGLSRTEDLVRRIYTDIPEFLHRAAGVSVESHLRRFVKLGRVTRNGEDWQLA